MPYDVSAVPLSAMLVMAVYHGHRYRTVTRVCSGGTAAQGEGVVSQTEK